MSLILVTPRVPLQGSVLQQKTSPALFYKTPLSNKATYHVIVLLKTLDEGCRYHGLEGEPDKFLSPIFPTCLTV